MRVTHLTHPTRQSSSLCSKHKDNYKRYSVSLSDFVIKVTQGENLCKNCVKRIKRDTSLLHEAKIYLKDEIYGIASLILFASDL